VNEFAPTVEEELVGLLNGLNINEFLSCAKDLGVGFTPLLRLPEEENPYDEKGIPIFIKKEYLNFGESQKSRPFTVMHFYNIVSGGLEGKDTIAIATSSKFGLAAKLIIPEMRRWFQRRGVEVPGISLELYMSRKFEEEDPHILSRLRGDRTRIIGCSNGWCPTEQSDRGQEVAMVREIEKYLPNYRAYHQHGDSLNLLAYFLQLAPEIFYQTGGTVTHYLSGTGTCGSLVGGGTGLKMLNQKVKVVGLIPQKDHVQLGLRSRNELRVSRFFSDAEKMCERLVEVSNVGSWSRMLELWEIGVPSGMTGGTYVHGSLELAKELYANGEEGVIVTLIPDSCEDHENLYGRYFPGILGRTFNKDLFEELSAIAKKERDDHVYSLRNSSSQLFERIVEHWSKNEPEIQYDRIP